MKENLGLEYTANVPIYITGVDICDFYEPSIKAIFINHSAYDISGLAHEMTHAEMHNRLGNNYSNFPRWLDEGLATQNDSSDSYADWRNAKKGIIFKRNYPETEDDNNAYYAVHQEIVRRWIERKGVDIVKELLKFLNTLPSDKLEGFFYNFFRFLNLSGKLKNFLRTNDFYAIKDEVVAELHQPRSNCVVNIWNYIKFNGLLKLFRHLFML